MDPSNPTVRLAVPLLPSTMDLPRRFVLSSNLVLPLAMSCMTLMTSPRVIDKTAPDWPASIAATGLALACYLVGVERGFMSRFIVLERTLTTLPFFWNNRQDPELDCSGYKGFHYHFLDMQNGRRADWQWAQNQGATVTHS